MTSNGKGEKVALVSGGARGLGRAMCLGLLEAGYAVAACDLASSQPELAALGSELDSATAGRFLAVTGDVSNWQSCRDTVDQVVARFGTVDILVNNAGFGMERVSSRIHDGSIKFYDLDEEFWTSLIDVNFNGAFRLAKLVVPYQRGRGWGRIVNITTSLATMIRRGFSPYGPSKAALEAATAIWAQDLAGDGITVNALLPGGPVNTRLIPVEDVSDRSTLIKPDVMVAPLTWLVSGAADGVTGQRFVAKQWDAALSPTQAAQRAGAPAAWDATPVWK